MSKLTLSIMLKSSTVLVREQTFMWKKDKALFLKSLVGFLK